MKKLLLIVCFASLALCSAAQQNSEKKAARIAEREAEQTEPWKTRYLIGANVIYEGSLNWSPTTIAGGTVQYPIGSVNFGVSFEGRISRHSGFETGLYLRHLTFPETSGLAYSTSGFGIPYTLPRVTQYFISIPLMYKYYSRILNVAAGFTFDIYSGGGLVSLYCTPSVSVGLALKVTKDIRLCKDLYLEPYVQYDQKFNGGSELAVNKYSFWLGVGVGLKYRF